VRPRMRICTRRVLIIVGLIAWLFGGPVAIVYGGCVTMGATCQGPCLLTSLELPTLTGPAVRQVLEPLHHEPLLYLPTPSLKVLTPPPRSALFS